jgi:hypothetical protein
MQIFPGNMFDNAPDGIRCDSVQVYRQTNATLVNYSLPLFGNPSCRWIPQVNQWGRSSCDTNKKAFVTVCGSDSTCRSCVTPLPAGTQEGVPADTNSKCYLAGPQNTQTASELYAWPLEPRSSVRATCQDSANKWESYMQMPLDGGVAALNPPHVSTFSVSVGAANTVIFIITYQTEWNGAEDKKVPSVASLPSPSMLKTWVSFQRQCSSSPLLLLSRLPGWVRAVRGISTFADWRLLLKLRLKLVLLILCGLRLRLHRGHWD